MHRWISIVIASGLLLAFGAPRPVFALELGEEAGPIDLVNSDGSTLTMKNYAERPATAVLFLSGRCPVTEQSIAGINRLYRKYRLRNVLYVGICSNTVETGPQLREFIQQRGVIFPLYRDSRGVAAKRLGATRTPEVFLLDRAGKLIFHGGLGDEKGIAALEAAVKNVLAKRPVDLPGVKTKGTDIDKPGAEIQRKDIHPTLSFSSELIFEKIPRAVAFHCSTIAQAANGDLLCLWYGGSYESADDQVLFLARRKPDARHWSRPEVVIRGTGRPPGNGVIFVDARGRVQIVWCRMESTRPIRRGAGWDHCRLMSRYSTDHGRTWSPDRVMLADDELVQQDRLWGVPRNPPVTMPGGTMVLANEAVIDGKHGSIFLISNDDGRTWKRGGFTTGGSQPTLAVRRDGSLLALMRRAPRITEITSTDDGRTWSDAKRTVLRNPNAGIAMTQLSNGHLVLVFNDTSTKRTPLSIVRSLDEGKTWEKPLHLESNPGEYSYPAVIQSGDGKIHVTYTFRRYAIKHVELNENWLVHTSRAN